MKTSATWAVVTLVLAGGMLVADPPVGPAPTKQHEWLKQLEGEWVTESEAPTGPGQPPVKSKGTEVVRSLGGFFTVGEIKSDFMGQPLTGIMTLGFDPQAKKYVGIWVCSVDGYFWKYEGSLDAAGKVLTLNTEGPGHVRPGQASQDERRDRDQGQRPPDADQLHARPRRQMDAVHDDARATEVAATADW